LIVSHRHRFIFFAVPRTATHSLRRALRGHLGADDWEQQMLSARQALPVPELAALGHGHVSLRQARAHLPPQIHADYFKFAFVRNPFDRFVSACCFLNRGNPEFPGNERTFMKRALSRRQFRRRVLIVPQTELLTDDPAHPAMNYIGSFESLQDCYVEVCGHLGLPAADLGTVNASPRNDAPCGAWRRYYDDELAAAVSDYYQADLRAFGYADIRQSGTPRS
jgi:hypothetical protein